MYIISQLTGKIYLNGVEIPLDDSTQEFQQYLIDKDIVGVEYVESTEQEIAEANKPIVPETISRMRFIIQVFLTTGIKYEEIVAFIQNLPTEVIDEASKYIVLTRLRSCTHLDRNSTDFNLIADMMGITPEQRDEIFINGNL